MMKRKKLTEEHKKICIEVGNIFHHQGNYAEERIKHFKKYG